MSNRMAANKLINGMWLRTAKLIKSRRVSPRV